MPRTRAQRNLDRRLSHNWEKAEFLSTSYDNSFVQEKWQCSKCGVTVKRTSERMPGRYIRFEPFRFQPTGETTFVHRTSGMLCDELVAWQVMES